MPMARISLHIYDSRNYQVRIDYNRTWERYQYIYDSRNYQVRIDMTKVKIEKYESTIVEIIKSV